MNNPSSVAIKAAQKIVAEARRAGVNSLYESHIKAIIESELASVTGWREIESAPRDGTEVLMAWTDGHIKVASQIQDETKAFWFEEAPTHWMPLPAPPKE